MNPKRQKPSLSPRALARALRYLWHYRLDAGLAYATLLLATAAQLLVPQMVQNMIDAIANGLEAAGILGLSNAAQAQAAQRLGLTLEQLAANQSGAQTALMWGAGLIVLFAVVQGLFTFSQAYMGQRASQGVAYDMRNDLFAKIQRLSFSYHDRNQTGQLMVRATDDVEKVRIFVGQGLLMALQSVVLMSGTLLILFLTNVHLTLVILPILPVAIVLFVVFNTVVRPMFTEVQRRLSSMNAILQENVAGVKVVKAFSREPEQIERFDDSADSYMRQMLTVMKVMTFLMPTIFLMANLGQALILYYGGNQIIANQLTLGEWQKFSLYLVFVFFPVGQLGFIITQMAQASASASRIYEILDAESELVEAKDAPDLPPVEGRVEFDHVTFRYLGSDRPVLNDVSLAAEPGQTIALLGMTGSGKSTIINLIPRFYDPSEGAVLIDGHDLRQVTLDSIRRQIGIVLQETTLFTGTIRDNIAYGRVDATQEQVEGAARAAAAHDFIMEFPNGYATHVGERGTTLSGGQKQRVAIARALLLDPRILILDDSTSNVDLQTEYEIQQALDRLMHGRTSFVIAQRISTVLNADAILVLEKGSIAAQGTHEELLETSEIYAEIYHSQLMEDAAIDSLAEPALSAPSEA
jgi:ATP-binding cassette subfamily B multidrug efflux pump